MAVQAVALAAGTVFLVGYFDDVEKDQRLDSSGYTGRVLVSRLEELCTVGRSLPGFPRADLDEPRAAYVVLGGVDIGRPPELEEPGSVDHVACVTLTPAGLPVRCERSGKVVTTAPLDVTIVVHNLHRSTEIGREQFRSDGVPCDTTPMQVEGPPPAEVVYGVSMDDVQERTEAILRR